MMLALVMPEVMEGMVLVDYLSARASEQEMQKWASQDGTEWSLTHAFYANLGGFVVRFPSSHPPTSTEFQPELDQSLSDSSNTPSKEATSDQSIKHPGVTEPMISDLEWQALPSNLNAKKLVNPLSPARCPCQNDGRSAVYEYMSLENIQAHKQPFRNGRFRIIPKFIKPLPSDIDTSHISQAICDYANK